VDAVHGVAGGEEEALILRQVEVLQPVAH
jgi:hypothetical protein